MKMKTVRIAFAPSRTFLVAVKLSFVAGISSTIFRLVALRYYFSKWVTWVLIKINIGRCCAPAFMIVKKVVHYLLARKAFYVMSRTEYTGNVRSLRAEYRRREDSFTEEQLPFKDPITQFSIWFEEACNTSNIIEPNAMCLATCTKSGLPSARFVLLKAFGREGFKFFTNYGSRKGEELEENPNAALVLYWEKLQRSIRIEGTVEKLSEEESTEYFQSRPRGNQIGAICSDQSRPICSREALVEKEKEVRKQYAGSDTIPKPENWGGYIVRPNCIEFWQGQTDRLHDRIRFRIPKDDEVPDNVLLHEGENGWVYERLQP